MTIAVMYFAMGFLAASLLCVAVLPQIHARAERLTRERLKDCLPISVGEIMAEKDLLRADFAMTVCRLELRIEKLMEHAALHLAELGRKADIINKLTAARDEQKDEILELRAELETLQDWLAPPSLVPSPSLFRRNDFHSTRTNAA